MALETPTLHTDRLVLRPLAESDTDALWALHTDRHVLRYWDEPPWMERSRALQLVTRSRQRAADGSGVRVAVAWRDADECVGWVALLRWNPDFRSAAIGLIFGQSAWGQGVATEAARALLGWAYGTLDLNRVQAEVDTRNVACARVLEKLGFVREGTMRQDCIVEGVVSDSWVYGLLGSDWEAAEDGRA
ncbi:GNAT family N-acetyltransferase [Arsenicicoccus sp. oral taxon 190]|uniref:GNAT family N-acetyltransferase n=1 Tax=Arsenicicoccus sp. oral taxon 190 TaxID=1658671 RepID=UPI00067A3F1B|nr:GNAT family N-acetyltransferase [Arsenicicoccus sp. oral taxon 190]AKT50585.1 GCN5 family acetyltransferase [Arsenicicoccus sp. oral taxon 190]